MTTKQKYTQTEIAAMSNGELRWAIFKASGGKSGSFNHAGIRYEYRMKDGTHTNSIPRWPTDANVALELVNGKSGIHLRINPPCELFPGWSVELYQAKTQYRRNTTPGIPDVVISGIEEVRYMPHRATSTPARAIAEAWLQWKQEQAE